MAINKLPALLLLIASIASASDGGLKASHLRPAPGDLGPDWTGPSGLILDDLDHPPPADGVDASTLNMLREQMKPLGVCSLADFTFRRKDRPQEQVTVRVFVFASEEQCRDWIRKRYQNTGWEKHYRRVDGAWDTGLDSLEMRKRIVASGRVWITSGTVSGQVDHLKALDLVLGRLREWREAATVRPGADSEPPP